MGINAGLNGNYVFERGYDQRERRLKERWRLRAWPYAK